MEKKPDYWIETNIEKIEKNNFYIFIPVINSAYNDPYC